MSAAQGELLGKAAGSVKPGGALVYATCSMFTRENETVVRAFLDSHADFRPEPVPHPLTGAPTGGMVRIWPWEGDCDAMFASRLRRLG
jgi:16S rRNA (cytosine967-C5)-methyltransferase